MYIHGIVYTGEVDHHWCTVGRCVVWGEGDEGKGEGRVEQKEIRTRVCSATLNTSVGKFYGACVN